MSTLTPKKHILFAVLNWGLGHATRSIPIINFLLKNNFKVTLASDGLALQFLQNRFPETDSLELLSLEMTYAEKGSLVFGLAKKTFGQLKKHHAEQKLVSAFLKKNTVDGIISDNRPSVFSVDIPSAYITHQWHVEAGTFTKPASFLHQQFAKKFTQIWIPDVAEEINVSGKLGHKNLLKHAKHIGLLSDLKPETGVQQFDVAAIISGPEPQRTQLENEIINQLRDTALRVALLRGSRSKMQQKLPENWWVLNVATRQDVQQVYATSGVIIARSGYSTLMDLYTLPKPAILVATPGQPEQEYLAKMPLHNTNFAVQQQSCLRIISGIEDAKKRFEKFTPVKSEVNFMQVCQLFLR